MFYNLDSGNKPSYIKFPIPLKYALCEIIIDKKLLAYKKNSYKKALIFSDFNDR